MTINEVERKNPSSEPKWLFVIIIGAVAGIIGGYVRANLLEYGELSVGFSNVSWALCAFYVVFAGMIAAVIVNFLLNLVDKDGQVPVDDRLFLSAILGLIAGFLIVSDYWF